MKIIEELWYGNIAPYETPIEKGSEYDIANKLVVRNDEALTATLSEQQKEIFEKFKNANLDMLSLGERDAFAEALLLAHN